MKKINSFMLLSSRLALLALTTLILSCSLFEAEDEAEDEPANETNKISSISDSDGSDNQVTENAAEGTTVGITAYASDADSGDTVTYSLNDDASGRFTINSGSGVVTVASGASIDYETAASHNIEVKATSSDGSTSTKAFGIAVLDEDESTGGGDATNSIGAISDVDNSSNKVDENASVGTAVGITAYAEDADAEDSVSYTLSDSAGNKFAINETSGVVTVNAKLNYESAASHSIMVQATSSDGSSTRKSFGINVIDDPNESNDGTSNDISAISDSDDSANQVNENAANGTLVGITALADDADEGEGVSYSLLRDADGRFGINATSGVVSVTDGSKINYERERAHTIEVLATSDDTSTSSAEFVISVLDVADESATDQHDVTAPEDADASANQVDESASIGTTVGITAYATDADDSDGVRYSLARSANGRFKIDGTTGVVTTAKALDYEADPSHYITVNANSDDGSVASTEFNIAVNDAAEISTTISGVAVDGYLQGANVCLDKDGDQKCTAADSAVATTTADGGYSLVVDAGDAELYPVLVQVIGGTTIDSDDPNGEPVAKDSIMNAPAGKYSLVSPLTTLVQGKIAGNSGLDADAAERLVIDDLGIDSDSNLSLFDDYVAEKQNTDLDSEAQADYDFVHSVAQLVAQAIADNIEKVSNDLNESTVVDADGEDFNEVVQIVVTEVAEDLSEVAEAVDEAIEQTEEGEEVNLTAVYEDIDDELTVDANASELEEEVALLEHEAEAQSGTSVADFMAAGFHYLDTDSEYISSNNSICYVYEYSDMVFDWDNFYSLDYDYDGDTGVFVSDGDQSAGEPSYVLVDNQWLYQPEEPLELLAENDDGSINILVREGELKIGGEVLDISGQELLTFIADDGWAEVIESYDPTVSFGAGAEILSIYDEYLVDSYWIDADSGCHDDIEDDVAANCSLIVEDSGNFYAQELSDLLNGDIFRSGSLGHYDLQFEGELNASDIYSSTGLVHFYADEENASLVATAEWYIVELAGKDSLKFRVPLALLNDDDGADAPYYFITYLEGALHYVEHTPAGYVLENSGTFFNRAAMDDILSAFISSGQNISNACALGYDDDYGDNDGSDGSSDTGVLSGSESSDYISNAIISPNGGELLAINANNTIAWDPANFGSSVDLYLISGYQLTDQLANNTDGADVLSAFSGGGYSYSTIATGVTNSGSYTAGTYDLYAYDGEGSMVLVISNDNGSFDFSDDVFHIVTNNNVDVNDTSGYHPNALIYPNGGEEWQHNTTVDIKWDASVFLSDSVSVYVYADYDNYVEHYNSDGDKMARFLASEYLELSFGAANSGSYNLVVDPERLRSGDSYIVAIVSDANKSIFDVSDAAFTIINDTVNYSEGGYTPNALIYPNGGEQWVWYSLETVKWNIDDFGSSVNLYLLAGNSSIFDASLSEVELVEAIKRSYMADIDANITNSGSYTFDPEILRWSGSSFAVLITDSDDDSVFDVSDDSFYIEYRDQPDDDTDDGSDDGSDDNSTSDSSYQDWSVNDILGETLYLVYEDLDYYSDSGAWESAGNVINTIQFAGEYSIDQGANMHGAPYQGLFGYAEGATNNVGDLSLTWWIDGNGILHLAEDAEGHDITEMAKVSSSADYYEIQAIQDDDGSVFDDWVKDSVSEYLYFDKSQAEAACASRTLGCSDSGDTNGPDLTNIYQPWSETELVDKGFYVVSPEQRDDGQVSFYGFYLEFNATHITLYKSFDANGEINDIDDWSIAEADGILDVNSEDPYVLAKVSTLSDGTIQVVYGDDRDDLQDNIDGYEMFFTSEEAATNYCLAEQGGVCLETSD